MPAIQYWFSGPALGAFLALIAATSTLTFAWYSSALSEKKAADAERAGVIQRLTHEYMLSHDNLSPALIAGTEPVPREWMNQRLQSLGYSWRL